MGQSEIAANLEKNRIKAQITKSEVAQVLGIHKNTYTSRLKQPMNFTLIEMIKLVELFELNSIEELFGIEVKNFGSIN